MRKYVLFDDAIIKDRKVSVRMVFFFHELISYCVEHNLDYLPYDFNLFDVEFEKNKSQMYYAVRILKKGKLIKIKDKRIYLKDLEKFRFGYEEYDKEFENPIEKDDFS